MNSRKTLSLPAADAADTPADSSPKARRAPLRPNAPRQRPSLAQRQASAQLDTPTHEVAAPAVTPTERQAPGGSARRGDGGHNRDVRGQGPGEPRPAAEGSERPERGTGRQAERRQAQGNGPNSPRANRGSDTRRADTRRADTRGADTRGLDNRGPMQSARHAPTNEPRHKRGEAPAPTPPRGRGQLPSPSPSPSPSPTPDDAQQGVRLSKLMSERGLASRREADVWIEAGWVSVDGRVVDALGTRVALDAHIEIDAQAKQQQTERVTILINKPIGYVSGQAEDGHEPAISLIRAETRWNEDKGKQVFQRGQLRKLAPAGRLDIDSTGLLVLTQDGRIAKWLIGDESPVEKEYLVRVRALQHPDVEDVQALVPPEDIQAMRHGMSLDGQALRPAQVSWQNEQQLRVVLREGRKRQIRRMCELIGLKVIGLKRVRIGSVVLGKLPLGQWRYLQPYEHF